MNIELDGECFLMKSFTPGIVQIKQVMVSRPDRSQTDAARPAQRELQTAERPFSREWSNVYAKLFGHEIFVSAQTLVDVIPQDVQAVDVSRRVAHQDALIFRERDHGAVGRQGRNIGNRRQKLARSRSLRARQISKTCRQNLPDPLFVKIRQNGELNPDARKSSVGKLGWAKLLLSREVDACTQLDGSAGT